MELLNGTYIYKLILSFLGLITTYVLTFFIKKSINAVSDQVKSRITGKRILSKTQTIRTLLNNIVDFVLFTIVILIILSVWGVNIVPLITGAGIIGLAISFGAQSLVKDVIAGFFIIVEDQFNVGDKIKVSEYEGEVYKITLRLTILKDKEGNRIYLPNSQITSYIKYH